MEFLSADPFCFARQGVIALFSFGDGTMLYAGSVLAGFFVLMLFAFPWRTISAVVQGLCLSVSLPAYFVFIGCMTVSLFVTSSSTS